MSRVFNDNGEIDAITGPAELPYRKPESYDVVYARHYCEDCELPLPMGERGLCRHCLKALEDQPSVETMRAKNIANAADFRLRAEEWRAKGDEQAARNWERRASDCERWARMGL